MKNVFFQSACRQLMPGFLLLVLVVMIPGPGFPVDAENVSAQPSSASEHVVVDDTMSKEKPLEAILPINVNTADEKTLTRVPGINKNAAKQIIQNRDKNGKYTKLEQLIGFSGIGETSVYRLKKYLVVK